MSPRGVVRLVWKVSILAEILLDRRVDGLSAGYAPVQSSATHSGRKIALIVWPALSQATSRLPTDSRSRTVPAKYGFAILSTEDPIPGFRSRNVKHSKQCWSQLYNFEKFEAKASVSLCCTEAALFRALCSYSRRKVPASDGLSVLPFLLKRARKEPEKVAKHAEA